MHFCVNQSSLLPPRRPGILRTGNDMDRSFLKELPYSLIGCCYRPPNTCDNFYDLLENSLENATKKNVILVGDFNAKHTEELPTDTTDQAGNRIKDISDSFNLTQLCSSPTHLNKTGQPSSLLDLAFTDLPNYCRSGTLPPLSSSDHLPVMVNVNLEIYTSGQSC